MYWKIDQRLPIDGIQDKPAPRGERASAYPSGNAFQSLLAGQVKGHAPTASGLAEFLSKDTVRLLAMALNLYSNDATDTTMGWLANQGVASFPSSQLELPAGPAPEIPVGAAQPTPTANRNLGPSAVSVSNSAGIPPHIASLIDKAASRYHLDPALISSVIEQESSFNPQAVSPAGAQGLMQLMPETARDLNVTDTFDPAQNIDGGSRYLAGLIQRYHGNVKMALAAYNWGMGNLEGRHQNMPAETRHYVASIMKRWQQGSSLA